MTLIDLSKKRKELTKREQLKKGCNYVVTETNLVVTYKPKAVIEQFKK